MVRDTVTMAISEIWDRKLAARVRSDMLDTDRFLDWQIRYIIDAFFQDAALRDETWEWLRRNFDAVLNKLSPPQRAQLGNLVGGCDLRRSGEIETFLKARAAQLPRYENFTTRARESVRLCAALSAARGTELAAILHPQPESIQ